MEGTRPTVTRAEAARRVGCSTWSIDRLIDEGKLRVVRIGVGRVRRHMRIAAVSLDALLIGVAAATKGGV